MGEVLEQFCLLFLHVEQFPFDVEVLRRECFLDDQFLLDGLLLRDESE